MRMWMVDPKILCNKHLLGEHVELHMFIGSINKGRDIEGYVKNNLIEPSKLYQRHQELVNEMKRRGMNHKSELNLIEEGNVHVNFKKYYDMVVDKDKSLKDLISRCPECQKRYDHLIMLTLL